jgi:hypothetical protein
MSAGKSCIRKLEQTRASQGIEGNGDFDWLALRSGVLG